MKMLLATLFTMFSTLAIAQRMDGAWLDSGCYGCPGDPVRAEVKAAQVVYDEAVEALAADYSIENLLAAADTALFSHVKAGYLLEAGRLSIAKGETVQAKKFYEDALDAAESAIKIADNDNFKGRDGSNVPKKSQSEGRKWKKAANKALKSLGAGEK